MYLRATTIVALVGTIGACGLAFAQAPDPRPGATTPVQVMNGASNPVPVSGKVTLGGSPSVTVSGNVATTSADSTVLIHEEFLTVNTTVDANHRTAEVDVSPYKYVRVVAARSSLSCAGGAACNGNTVRVENPDTLDQVSFPGSVSFPVFQEVYTVPGQKLTVAIANGGSPATSVWAVRIYGRRN
jgi:hypothetical protein